MRAPGLAVRLRQEGGSKRSASFLINEEHIRGIQAPDSAKPASPTLAVAGQGMAFGTISKHSPMDERAEQQLVDVIFKGVISHFNSLAQFLILEMQRVVLKINLRIPPIDFIRMPQSECATPQMPTLRQRLLPSKAQADLAKQPLKCSPAKLSQGRRRCGSRELLLVELKSRGL